MRCKWCGTKTQPMQEFCSEDCCKSFYQEEVDAEAADMDNEEVL